MKGTALARIRSCHLRESLVKVRYLTSGPPRHSHELILELTYLLGSLGLPYRYSKSEVACRIRTCHLWYRSRASYLGAIEACSHLSLISFSDDTSHYLYIYKRTAMAGIDPATFGAAVQHGVVEPSRFEVVVVYW